MPDWLECQCDNCHRTITFTPEQNNTWINCPFCKHSVFLCLPAMGRATRSGNQARNIPAWVLVTVSLVSIIALLTFGYTKLIESVSGVGAFPPVAFWSAYGFFFPIFAGWVLGISLAIYVFNWLREVRMLLRQIEHNTRPPEEGQVKVSSPSPPPKPVEPSPEEHKYMPKS